MLGDVPEMSASRQWHFDCLRVDGARDTGDGNITSCSRFSVTVVRTVTRDKGDAVFPRCVASFFPRASPKILPVFATVRAIAR